MDSATKKTYIPPVITRVQFDDQALVAFAVCRKATQLSADTASCCNVLPYGTPNYTNYDPS